MTVSAGLREKVRKRAHYNCQYCGTSETESGGELTVDHFKPESAGGSDALNNLVYACFRCNVYKGEFWNDERPIFDPLKEKPDDHFWISYAGEVLPLTDVGKLTIDLLRLNRPPLVNRRRDLILRREEQDLLNQTKDSIESLKRLSHQQRTLLKEQRALLKEQRRLLDLLYRK